MTDVSTTCAVVICPVVKMAIVTTAQVVETVTVKNSPFRTTFIRTILLNLLMKLITPGFKPFTSENGDGRENVAKKVNSRSLNLHRDYSKSLTLSNVGELS